MKKLKATKKSKDTAKERVTEIHQGLKSTIDELKEKQGGTLKSSNKDILIIYSLRLRNNIELRKKDGQKWIQMRAMTEDPKLREHFIKTIENVRSNKKIQITRSDQPAKIIRRLEPTKKARIKRKVLLKRRR